MTGKVEIACDGEVFTAYGFPAFWITPGATSLAQAADFTAMIFDAAIYFLIFAALGATNLFDNLFGRKRVLIASCLWAATVIVGGIFLIFLLFDVNWQKTDFFPCEQSHYSLHLGLPFKR